MVYDVVAVYFSYFSALWLRFDLRFTRIPATYLLVVRRFLPIYCVLCVVVFWLFRLYRSIWRFASYTEVIRLLAATAVTCACHCAGITIVCRALTAQTRMPYSYFAMGFVCQFALTLLVRFAYRLGKLMHGQRKAHKRGNAVLLIGAGSAGQSILRDINHTQETEDRVVCLIDDDSNKWGRSIDGVPVVGGREEILSAVEKYGIKKIYFAIPTATGEQKRDILNICQETGCELKQLPGIYQLVKGDVTLSQMKKVDVEDLLGRDPIKADMEGVYRFINGKTVLVTGGGGSIGSELCRQIAGHHPKQLIIFDIYENNAYSIQLELKDKYPELNLVTLIGSVRDSRRMFQVFEEYRPQVVYHAAAHKHVPLMEDSPCESIKNNAIGTYKTAYAAMTHGCERFVLISTDKAVNPTNIMGASKRLCEMVIQSFDRKIKEGKANELPQLFTHDGVEDVKRDGQLFGDIKTEFVAVRFGNVLGSNGSVIPVFRKQIEKGGPVTVTHPDIIRYFMTIPEAVSLVMLAGTYAHGGEIFVLDMGSPVKIDTLARNLIKLSGLRPDIDIKIEYTGLRPGEKLYEEKLMAEEGLKKTDNKLIHIGQPIPFDTDRFLSQLVDLMLAAYQNKPDIRERVAQIVNTYKVDKAA
ncbi:MAG: polysaccharide biosynthesis protein [Clostridia bacterium]|nr:polysaccharide biosynthesis protein [Clostridia bacterium]MBO4885738.1 polysaccharide biosynthesis protein [Clostridia bacterium]